MKTIDINFKDPDFGDRLRTAGVTPAAATKLERKAEHGEYWKLRLKMHANGSIADAKFVKS